MAHLDCVVIGYNEGDFDDYGAMCGVAGADSPEMQIYRTEHLVVDGHPMPWLEAFSRYRRRATGRPDRYHVGEMFNLAALYLTSFLGRRGLAAEAVSLFSAERDRLAALLAERPAVVAVTTTFYVNILPVAPVVEFVRRHSPTSHVVIGGPLIDNLCGGGITEATEDLLFAMGADSYVVDAQGESALVDLCRAIRAGEAVTAVDNLVHCAEGRWALTRRRPENNCMDDASIDWSAFDPDMIGVTAQVRTARSCAFKCAFCDYPSRAGSLALASLEVVREELRALAEIGVRNVVFVDDTFNVPVGRFKALCRMLIEEDLGLRWYSYFRCSNARDVESFDLAARSGCAGVFLGIESGDPSVLANMRKLAQDSQYRSGIARLKERGITTFASIIVGFPGETAATVANTVDFLNETGPDFWRAQAWWANPRSPVYGERDRFGIQGEGYQWSHDTMTSAEAAALTDSMFSAVSGSTWLPLYDFDFWALPYLEGKGLRAGELAPLLRASQRLMHSRMSGAPPRALDALEGGLAGAVGALDLAPAKFALEPA